MCAVLCSFDLVSYVKREHSASFGDFFVLLYSDKPDRNSKELTLWRRTFQLHYNATELKPEPVTFSFKTAVMFVLL